jgi:hypothetical protein
MDDEAMFALFDSLKREMDETRREFREEMKQELRPIRDSLERIETRLSRQGILLQGGARQVAGWRPPGRRVAPARSPASPPGRKKSMK